MSGGIDEALVRHIAHLSRLTVSDDEVRAMTVELSAIVTYIDQLAGADTSNVPETAHPAAVSNVFREDVIGESYGADRSLLNAPQREREFFRVPKVLDAGDGA